MSHSVLGKFLVPALLTSSVVFTAFNLPIYGQFSNPILTQFLLLGSRNIEPTTMGAQGVVRVRYVGVTLIISVAAGLATAESIRRWSTWRQSVRNKKQRLSPEDLAAYAVDSGLGQATSSNLIDELPSATTSLLSSDPALADFEDQTLGPDSPLTAEMLSPQPDPSQIYEICRIRVPQRRQRLMAILVDGHYYRFLKAESDRDQAFNLVVKYVQKGEQAVITSMRSGYAVWVRETEAYADLAG